MFVYKGGSRVGGEGYIEGLEPTRGRRCFLLLYDPGLGS